MPVCTCQVALLPEPTCWTMAPWPSPVPETALCTWLIEAAEVAGNWMTDPPLKSTVKFSPRPNRPTRLSSRITPEIVYHSFWRPTKSKETSPR